MEEIGIQRMFKKYCKTRHSRSLDLVRKCLSYCCKCVDINCHLHPYEERMLTPLMYGCIHGYEDLVKVLSHDERIDLNQQDREGFTALHYAVAFQQRQCVFHLTQGSILTLPSQNKARQRIDPNITRYQGVLPETTIISAALALGNSEIVSMLIYLPDIKLDVKDSQGRSLAQVAVESDLARNKFNCTKVLSDFPGVDWSYTNHWGRTLLMIACTEVRPKLVSVLTKVASINLNSQDKSGLTAAHHAVMWRSLGCLEALRDVRGRKGREGGRTVDWNILSRPNQGETPLSLAIKIGDPEVVELLLSIPFVKLDQDISHMAVERKDTLAVEVVEILSRDERVDWEVRDQQGDTPILSALRKKKPDMVRILLRNPRIDLSEVREVARGARTVEGVEAGEVETLLWETLVEVRTRLGQVEDSLPRCPVCYQRLSSPPGQVLQCEEGHLVCAQCGDRPELVHCPVCRGEMAGRAIGVEQFLQDLL